MFVSFHDDQISFCNFRTFTPKVSAFNTWIGQTFGMFRTMAQNGWKIRFIS